MDEFEGESASTRETLRYCVQLARPNGRFLLTGAGFLVLGVIITDVATPLVFAEVLDRIAVLGPHTRLWPRFGALIVAYGVLIVVGQVFFRFSGWLQWEGSLRSFANGIHRSFERLLALGYRWHVDHSSGEVASSLSSFSWAFVDGLDNLHWGILRIVVVVLCAIAVLAVYAWPVAVVLIVLTVAFVAVVVKRSGPVTEASRNFSKAHSRAEGTASDVIRNVSTVLVGAGEEAESAKLHDLLDASVRADLRGRRVFIEATLRDDSGNLISLTQPLAFAAPAQLIESFMQVRNLSRGLGRASKLVALVSTPPEIVDVPGAAELMVTAGSVRFDAVSFSYRPAQHLLADFNLELQPGEHVGIVGPSGGGKSTITRLVLRLMDVDGGRILVDGQDIARCTQASVRRAVSYVPQDPQMLYRTISENIWYGQAGPVDIDRVRQVATAAHVDEFVRELSEGYQTVVGERGLKLSGGQRQRVAIAQAMLKGAPVLILDEATSSLDSESERYVQEALWRLMAASTALVVAHRLSTIAQLDRIIVIDGGRVVETGTHRELLLAGTVGTYRRLWEHQSGGFLSS